MKKLLVASLIVAVSQTAFSQKTPTKPPRPPHPQHAPGELPPPPPTPPTPKELWQKLKSGKKKADAKRRQDLKEMGVKDPKTKK